MDEVHQRLIEGNFSRRFACFTLVDGYRDNTDFALPIMREFDAPLTVCVPPTSRHGQAVVDRAGNGDRQGLHNRSKDRRRRGRFDVSTLAAKHAAFERPHELLVSLPDEHDNIYREIAALCAGLGPHRRV
jgi:hypothetical protein